MGLLSARSSASCWCTYGIHDLPCHRDFLLSCLPLTCVHGCSFFNNLWDKFEAIDTSNDRRVDPSEFVRGCSLIGLALTAEEARDTFAEIDANGGGVVVPLLADRRAAPGVVKADDGVHARGLDVAPRARQLPVPPTGAQ